MSIYRARLRKHRSSQKWDKLKGHDKCREINCTAWTLFFLNFYIINRTKVHKIIKKINKQKNYNRCVINESHRVVRNQLTIELLREITVQKNWYQLRDAQFRRFNYLLHAPQYGALSDAAIRPSVCLSHARKAKRHVLGIRLTLIGNATLQVEPTIKWPRQPWLKNSRPQYA